MEVVLDLYSVVDLGISSVKPFSYVTHKMIGWLFGYLLS